MTTATTSSAMKEVSKESANELSSSSEWLQDLEDEEEEEEGKEEEEEGKEEGGENEATEERRQQEISDLKTDSVPISAGSDEAASCTITASVSSSTSTGHETDSTVSAVSSSSSLTMSTTPVPVAAATVPAAAHNPLFHGCRSVEAYQRLNYIDEGTYGLVFRAKDKQTGEEVALKQIKFDARHTSKVGFPITALRETNILLALHHPNIVRVKEMVVGSSVDKIYMVMEFLENDLKACMDMSKTPFSVSEVISGLWWFVSYLTKLLMCVYICVCICV
jgi:hypothetical protein